LFLFLCQVLCMSWSDHNRTKAAAAVPCIGAREITAFCGVLANDNDCAGTDQRGRRRTGCGLPIMAFASGLGAASFVTLAQHLLGL
jgi:hypothetical protein